MAWIKDANPDVTRHQITWGGVGKGRQPRGAGCDPELCGRDQIKVAASKAAPDGLGGRTPREMTIALTRRAVDVCPKAQAPGSRASSSPKTPLPPAPQPPRRGILNWGLGAGEQTASG